MDYDSFEKRLAELGVDVTMGTVRNWAKIGIIPTYTTITKREQKRKKKRERLSVIKLHAPTIRELEEFFAKNVPEDDPAVQFGFFDEPYKMWPISYYLGECLDSDEKTRSDGKARRKRERRPGRFTDWSKDALVETAAVWAMKGCNRDCKGNKIPPKAVTPEIIANVQLIAREVWLHPRPFYRITERMIDGIWPDAPFTYRDVEMKFVKDEKRNQLTRAYIAAVEKARHGIPVKEPRRVILKEDIIERDNLRLEESELKVIVDNMLARSAERRGRKLTPAEVKRVTRAYEKTEKGTSPVVCSNIDIDLESTDAECDEIELWVREPGGKWVDCRKRAMRCSRG